MEKATWEEIKRLAADFQRAQLGSSAPKLTEQNCIAIVSRLCDMGMLQVFYTNDGKSYLTPEELVKEIYEELEVQNGRVNLVELQQVIGVNFNTVETKVYEMLRSDSSLQVVLGQLIDGRYTRQLAKDISDTVEEQGHVTIGDLTKQFDLPTSFINSVIEDHRGTIISAHLDGETLFTEAFIARHRAQLRGYFSAVSKPVNLAPIITRYGIPEKLFHRLLDEMVSEERLFGSFATGRSTFIPEVYTKAQEAWVENFFQQNDYCEHDALRKLGISNPGQFLQKKFPKASHFSACSVGESTMSQVCNVVEECCAQGNWVDVTSSLPVMLNSNDLALLIGPLLKKQPGAKLYADSIVVSGECLTKCRKLFDSIMSEKAEVAVKENPKLLLPDRSTGKILTEAITDNKRQSKGKGKTGGGQRGRETKTKAVKNKYLADKKSAAEARDEDDIEGDNLVPFLNMEEIGNVLRRELTEDAPDDMVDELAEEFERPLLRSYQEVVRSVFLQTSNTAKSRASVSEAQEKLTTMVNNIRLFEKAAMRFTPEIQSLLLKHILRTHGGEVTNFLCGYVADLDNIEWDASKDNITHENRQKLISQLPNPDISEPLKLVNQSLRSDADKGLEGFYVVVDNLAGSLGMMIRKMDKKKEKLICTEFGMKLQDQVTSSTDLSDPALLLLTTVCLLCQGFIGLPVSAPGRSVPQLIGWLKNKITEDSLETLTDFEELVVNQLRAGHAGDEGLVEGLTGRLGEVAPKLKALATGWRKIASTNQGDVASPVDE